MTGVMSQWVEFVSLANGEGSMEERKGIVTTCKHFNIFGERRTCGFNDLHFSVPATVIRIPEIQIII